MKTPHLPDQTRSRLVALLGAGGIHADRLVERLRELRVLEKAPVCSAALGLLAHLDLPEDAAEQLLLNLVDHRVRIRSALGRDPGLHVAAIDYLTNVRPLLKNPTVLELSDLEHTRRTAITDTLTGLFNRRHFQASLDGEIRRSRRYSFSLSLVMLDLDDFKSVNDLYGHPLADTVLNVVGRIFSRAVRESDVACRFGGEEFAIVLPETGRLGAFAVAERLRVRLERRFLSKPVRDRIVALTVSGGVASHPEDGAVVDDLVSSADRALYRAKRRGKNRVVLYHDERRRAVRYPADRANELALTGVGIDGTHRAEVINISSSGVLVETPGSASALRNVELAFGRPGPVRIPGHVVRVEGAADGRDRARVAIEFDRPFPEDALQVRIRRDGSRPAGGEVRT